MNDSPTDADFDAAKLLVKSEQSEEFRNNLILQVARAISKYMKPERQKHRELSDQHDALIRKCNAMARYARHTPECLKNAGVENYHCACGLNDLLAGIEPI